MSAREQAEYEEKRERVKPAFRLYLDQEHTQFVTVTKEEYEAIDLPVVQEEIGTFKLCYRNRVLSASFVGDNRDEISVASAMKKYKEEAVRFAEQGMLATGYFNTRLYSEQFKVEISYTALVFLHGLGLLVPAFLLLPGWLGVKGIWLSMPLTEITTLLLVFLWHNRNFLLVR